MQRRDGAFVYQRRGPLRRPHAVHAPVSGVALLRLQRVLHALHEHEAREQ